MAKQQQPSANSQIGAAAPAKKKHAKKLTSAMREQEKQARRAAWNDHTAAQDAAAAPEKEPEPATVQAAALPAEEPAAAAPAANETLPEETPQIDEIDGQTQDGADSLAAAQPEAEAAELEPEPEAVAAWAPLTPEEAAPEEPEPPEDCRTPEEEEPAAEDAEQQGDEVTLPEAPAEQAAGEPEPSQPEQQPARQPQELMRATVEKLAKTREEKKKGKKPRKRHYFATYVAIFTVIVVAASAASIVLMFSTSGNSLFSTTPDVDLPNFNNLTRSAVEQDASYRNFHLVFEEVYNDEKAEGVIFDQSPKAPKQVKENASVTLRVSKGVHRVTVPDVVGWKKDTVREKLKSLELSILIKTEINKDRAANTVLRTEPKAGASLEAGGTVTVYVAAEPHDTNRVNVPNCVGMSRDKAVQLIGSNGLVAQTRKVSSGMPAGTVVAQTPNKSLSVRRGGTVMLSISTGSGDQLEGGQEAQVGQQLYPGGPTVGYGDGQVVPGSKAGHIHTWTAPDANGNQVCTVCAATRHVS